MKIKTNWHATWRPWTSYIANGSPYRSRSRQLYCGKLHIATLVQIERHNREPFYMYSAGNPRLTIRGSTAFRVVRRFMGQLR